MQRAQRAEDNHALEAAVNHANALGSPLVAAFVLTDRFPEANLRHYAFLCQGLAETRRRLQARGIPLLVFHGDPPQIVAALTHHAGDLVMDAAYTRTPRQWRDHVAEHAACRVTQVETDVVVPVETAAGSEQYSAATLRRRLRPHRDTFLVPVPATPLHHRLQAADVPAGLRTPQMRELPGDGRVPDWLDLDTSVGPVSRLQGGTAAAETCLEHFLEHGLPRYSADRSDPSLDVRSFLSPYLHFGQISPVRVALQVQAAEHVDLETREAFLEELIVRRELAINYTHYNPAYDRFETLPEWARKTLAEHATDPRPYLYDRPTLEAAQTHDPYWNAAQREMTRTGTMHNTMRMYWGKKVLEWTADPQEAFERLLYLNNKYELDGRDPASFAGVAWCFGKHDRPWARRPVFGTVRYMNANGLRRKYRIEDYAKRFPPD